jgi:hypothetical protein
MWEFMIRYGIYFGVAIWLIIFWRRVTAAGVMVGFCVWVVGIVVVPQTLGYVEAARTAPALLVQTESVHRASAGVRRPPRMCAARTGRSCRAAGLAGRACMFPRRFSLTTSSRSIRATHIRRWRESGRFNVELYTLHCSWACP